MKWYRDNRIVGSLIIAVVIIIAFLSYQVIKAIGPTIGKQMKTEQK